MFISRHLGFNVKWDNLKQRLQFIDNYFTSSEKKVLFYVIFIACLGLAISLYGFAPKDTQDLTLDQMGEYSPVYDINEVKYEQLLNIRGVGPSTANAILSYQKEYGFTDVNDLNNIAGIGERRFQNLSKHFSVRTPDFVGTQFIASENPTSVGTQFIASENPASVGTQFIASEPPLIATNTTSKKPAPTEKININTATADELVKLKGIGPVKAQAIIDYRKAHGKFTKIDDIMKVKGIGPKTFENIKDYISIGS